MWSGTGQGCQMKISIKSQTMVKRSQEKAEPTVWRPVEKPNFICGIAIPLSQKHLNYKNKLRWNFASHCVGAPIFPDFPWFVKLHSGHNGATVCCILIHRQLSARKSLPFTPVLTIRSMRPSTLTELSHFYREDVEDLSASVETV